MRTALAKLKMLNAQKKDKPSDHKKIIKKQLRLIRGLLRKDKQDERFAKNVLEQTKALIDSEYTIGFDDFKKLYQNKGSAEQLAHKFSEEIASINQYLEALQKLLEAQLDNTSEASLNKERELYNELQAELSEMRLEKEELAEYSKDLEILKHHNWSIGIGTMVSKIIKGTLFHIKVQGSEHIPRHGPVILAPRHINPVLEPIILKASVPRKLFFVAGVEMFIILRKYFMVPQALSEAFGTIPIKRTDEKYAGRLEQALPVEQVKEYSHTNKRSFKKILTYLKRGHALVMFPEGEGRFIKSYERPNNEEFLTPQDGSAYMAYLSERMTGREVPVVPVGMHYSKGSFSLTTVKIGKPRTLPSNLKKADRKTIRKEISKFTEELFEEIKRLSNE